ncbi:MAG: hypothetical protein V9E87_01900 [Gemmatimonadales bacterium]
MFGFFGVTDVRFVRAEGVAMGDAARAQAIATAEAEILALNSVAANQPQVTVAA